mmetsp:Transcript_6797/g.10620  ORF Transcript_6797/g.10620 Transcript_6797/m.10620 type:complete len:369 (+) Transcript_6797:121-1227(+)
MDRAKSLSIKTSVTLLALLCFGLVVHEFAEETLATFASFKQAGVLALPIPPNVTFNAQDNSSNSAVQWSCQARQDITLSEDFECRQQWLVVIGVFLKAEDWTTRMIIRNTWMSSAEEIFNGSNAGSNSVLVKFVLGKSKTNLSSEQSFFRDMLFLKQPENMNAGKTYHWFSYAVDHYPRAMHIMKADSDSYIRIPQLVAILKRKGTHRTFIGSLNECRHHCGTASRALGDLWQHMWGWGYILAMPLARWIRDSNLAKTYKGGIEDQMTAYWLIQGEVDFEFMPANAIWLEVDHLHQKYPHWDELVLVHALKTPAQFLEVASWFMPSLGSMCTVRPGSLVKRQIPHKSTQCNDWITAETLRTSCTLPNR